MKRRLLLILILITLTLNLFPQAGNYQFTQYTGDDGLSSREITCIKQDTTGFIWVGTNDGLNKLDGYSFRVYRNEQGDTNSVPGNHIRFIEQDNRGTLWIGTDRGLSKYNPIMDRFEQPLKEHSNNDCHAFVQDEQGNYWVASGTGIIHVYDSSFNKQNVLNEKNGYTWLQADHINDITIDNRGIVWIATPKGLYEYDPVSGSHDRFPVEPSNPDALPGSVMSVYEDSENILWIPTKDGLFYLESGRNQLREALINNGSNTTAINNDSYAQVIEDHNERLWIPNGKSGLAYFNRDSRSFTTLSAEECNGLTISGGIQQFIEIDHQGNIWTGGLNTSLNLIQPNYRNFKTINRSSGASSAINHDIIHSLTQDSAGSIWIATRGGGVDVWDRTTNTFRHLNPAAQDTSLQDTTLQSRNNIIKALYTDHEGKIWCGGKGTGLGFYNKQYKYTSVVNDTTKTGKYDIRDIIQDSDGMIWFITYGEGLFQVDPYSMEVVNNFNTRQQERSTQIISDYGLQLHLDNQDNIWIGTKNGPSIFSTKLNKFTNFTFQRGQKNSIAGEWIKSIQETTDGTIWLGTNNGLSMYKPSSGDFKNYTYENGLPGNNILGILEDHENNLWVSTSSGLSRFNTQTEEFKNYTRKDGLQGNEFSQGAYYKTANNELAFGGLNGLTIFDPANIENNPTPPKVYLTAFKLFHEEVDNTKSKFLNKHIHHQDYMKLPYKENVITFDFVGINYIQPGKNQYKYKLEGFDESWQQAGTKRSATYTNLNPGKYTFRVMAANNDGVWNETSASVQLRIKPPWWRSTAFYIILVLGVLALIYAYSRYRNRLIKRDKLILEQRIKQGEEELKKQQEEVEKQQEKLKQRDLEEMEMRFMTEGIAKFSDIISQHQDNQDSLGQKSITELVEYVGGNMGVLYMLNNEEEGNEYLELKGTYAADKNKISNKQYKIGEGFVGACYQDAETLVINDVPEDYTAMESGLGESKPTHLYLIPLKQNETVQGVIEIGSFEEIEEYKIRFLEKIAENITSVITITKTSQKAQAMLEKSNIQAEELQSQEEELRQNLEEMQATQEELQRRMKENEQMQEDLKYEKALLDAIMENFPDLIYFKDRDSKFLRVSKSMLDTLGIDKADDLYGKSDFDFHEKEAAQTKYNEEQEIMNNEEGVVDLIEHDVFENGTERWVSSTKLPFYDKDGNVIGTFGISKDVTALKEAEIAAQQNNEELQAQEEELRQNMEEMQATQDELQRRMEENQQMQEDLKYEKALLDAIMENLPDYIYFKDLDSKFLRVSRSMIKAKGVSDMEELLGKSDFDYHDKELAQAKYEEEQKIIKTKKGVVDLVEHDTLENGTEKWVSTTKLPFINRDGKVIGTFGISKDITEMKKVEIKATEQAKLLEQSEEELKQNIEELRTTQDELMEKQELLMWESAMFNALMNHLQSRISFKDREGKFRKVSRVKALKHGFKNPDDIIGKSDYDFFSKDHADKAFAEEQKLIKNGKAILDVEEKLVMKDGSVSWGSTSRIPFANNEGEIIGSFIMTRDITDIKLTRAELANKAAVIEGIAAHTPVLVYKTDVQGKLSDIQGAGLKFMNKQEKELIGKPLSEVFPEGKDKISKEIKGKISFNAKGKYNNETWEIKHHVFVDEAIDGAVVGYAYKTGLV